MTHQKRKWPIVFAFLLAGTASAKIVSVQLPTETATYKPGPGSNLANSRCLICHSADYVNIQPPTLTAAFWKATVLKMKNAYGATVPDEEIEPLVEYFVKNYSISQH